MGRKTMIGLLQRVTGARVDVAGRTAGAIEAGLTESRFLRGRCGWGKILPHA
jgi:hypothetical protein